MITFEIILLIFLIVCAIATCFAKNLFSTVMIFESYSAVMCVIWLLLRSPDLAITEAAVGAGVTGVLFYITLKNVKQLKEEDEPDEE
ncbi:MAG: DUF4040 domain-containing protein [Oscillospiraceae bacterium]|nr:DUF4040 domain-containing protein [Oscillospiraceae bacterium]